MSDDRAGLGADRPPTAAQHGPDGQTASSAQHTPDALPPPSAQHAPASQTPPGAQHTPDAQAGSSAQHAPNDPTSGSVQHATQQEGVGRRANRLQEARRGKQSVEHGVRHSRRLVRIALGSAAAAAAAAVIIVATQNDAPNERAAGPTRGATATELGQTVETGLGETLTGFVAADSPMTLPFTVEAGNVSYFAASPDCSDTGLQWVVEDSAGTPVTGAATICNDVGRVVFPVAGEYRITVFAIGPDIGDFSVMRKESRPDRILAISSGETLQGDIDLPGAQDVYEFQADAGTVGYFASEACDTSDLQWVVEDTAGTPVSPAAVVCGDVGRIDFPASGSYSARVYSVNGGTGTYDVAWKESRPDQRFVIDSGDTIEGDIDLPGAQDFYDFDVDAGTIAYFAAAEDCSENNRFWVVEDDLGVVVASTHVICDDIGRVTFPVAGRYHVRVYSVDGGTGAYSLTWIASRPDRERDLTFDAPVRGTIDLPGSRDIWTFDGLAGQSLVLTADPACDATDLVWFVQSADGTTISQTSVICSDLGTVELPSAGRFQVVVYPNGRATDDYTFRAAAG